MLVRSGTMTAYATASGYSQSSTVSKSCSYTLPELPEFSLTGVGTSKISKYYKQYYFRINASGMPTGTKYEYDLINSSGVAFYNASTTSTGLKRIELYSFDYQGVDIGSPGDLITFQVTASCTGYQSRTVTASAKMADNT